MYQSMMTRFERQNTGFKNVFIIISIIFNFFYHNTHTDNIIHHFIFITI